MLAKEEQIKAANERCETGAGRGRVCEQKEERRREREREVCLRSTKLSLSLSLFAQPRTSRSPALSPLDIYKKHAPGSITMNLSS
jgi:hypothetical protein